jgi:LemA protein
VPPHPTTAGEILIISTPFAAWFVVSTAAPEAAVTTLLAVLIVSAVLAVAVLAWFAMAYNGLVRRRNAVANAWSQVDVQLKRRYDLIPNLVETARGYAAHERPTFEAVIAARNAAFAAQGPAEQAKAENALTGTLRSLFALAESYPQLQASRTFADLQAELSDTENRIAYARQYYNDSVQTYNTKIQTFPSNIFAGMFNFTAREYFESDDEARGTVKVEF